MDHRVRLFAALAVVALAGPAAVSAGDKTPPERSEEGKLSRAVDTINPEDVRKLREANRTAEGVVKTGTDGYKPPFIDSEDGKLHLYIPPEVKTVRGVMFLHDTMCARGSEVAEVWQFAHVYGYIWKGGKPDGQVETFTQALAYWAQKLNRPELKTAPIIYGGESRTGVALTNAMHGLLPGRLLSYCVNVSSGLLPSYLKNYGPEAVQTGKLVPGIVVSSEGESFKGFFGNPPQADMADFQQTAALMWNFGHQHGTSNDMMWPYLDQAIRVRIPKGAPAGGAATLITMKLEDGWIGIYDKPSTFPEIMPFKAFKGDRAKDRAAWMPTEDAAWTWRAYMAHKPRVEVLGPVRRRLNDPAYKRNSVGYRYYGYTPQSAIEVEAGASEPPARMEFYIGSRKIGEAASAPWKITARNLPPGVWGLHVIATWPDGVKEASRPAILAIHGDLYGP